MKTRLYGWATMMGAGLFLMSFAASTPALADRCDHDYARCRRDRVVVVREHVRCDPVVVVREPVRCDPVVVVREPICRDRVVVREPIRRERIVVEDRYRDHGRYEEHRH